CLCVQADGDRIGTTRAREDAEGNAVLTTRDRCITKSSGRKAACPRPPPARERGTAACIGGPTDGGIEVTTCLRGGADGNGVNARGLRAIAQCRTGIVCDRIEADRGTVLR